MEILCPNCQKKLTILEQYAGQQMKCPLCANTFTAPALPSAPAAPASMPVQQPPVSSAGPPPSTPPQQSVPSAPAAPPPPQEPVPTEHTGRFSVWISPRCTQFVAPAALFLVFILTFFPWVGFYPGGICVDSQSAWQAMRGAHSTNNELRAFSIVARDKDSDSKASDWPVPNTVEPGFSILLLFYLLALLANLAVAGVVLGVGYAGKFVPPPLQPLLRWRWAALAAVTAASFFFLLLEEGIGFSLERRGQDAIEKQYRKMDEGKKETSKQNLVYRSILEQWLVRTFWFSCAFWFHFWALIFVFVTMLADLRAPRPCPRVDLLW